MDTDGEGVTENSRPKAGDRAERGPGSSYPESG